MALVVVAATAVVSAVPSACCTPFSKPTASFAALSKTLFRNSQIDEALKAIETALKEYPDNTSVLLQAAQMNCLSLRLKKQLNAAVVDRVRLYLSRLEKLMPTSDRVAHMQRYFRETLAALSAPATV